MLRLGESHYVEMVGHVLDALPYEGCGLLAGPPGTAKVERCYPCRNAEASARVYRLDPLEHLRVDRDADSRGLEVMGVFHSHTHTEAYPSPTDVEQAPEPGWHYVVISLKDPEPVLRSFRLADGRITEEPVVLEAR
jgi:proteasome lid subunit RPN8/RPN11